MSKSLPNTSATEYFDLKLFYYVLNKRTNKILCIKDDGSNIMALAKADLEGVNAFSNLHTEEGKIKYIEYVNQK
jgi:hypothetical protein